MEAIIVEGVRKQFKRYPTRTHYSLKRALFTGQLFRRRPEGQSYIEVLKDVSFTVPTSMTMGIIGRNGSGKSSLLKLLAGIYRPDAGHIEIRGRIAALLSLGVGFHPELTGRENVYINGQVLGLSRKQIRERFDEIVQFAEMEEFIDAPVRTYSSGMYVRLAFSIAVNVDADILLLDEVLAVGDAQFTQKCHDRMDSFKDQGKTILLVTHDLHTVETWCDRAMWLDRGEVRAIGEPSEVTALYKQGVPEGVP